MPLYNPASLPSRINTNAIPSDQTDLGHYPISTTATQILGDDPYRKGFSIYNNGSKPVYIADTASVNTTDTFIMKINPDGFYEWGADSGFASSLWAISDDNTEVCVHQFGVAPVDSSPI